MPFAIMTELNNDRHTLPDGYMPKTKFLQGHLVPSSCCYRKKYGKIFGFYYTSLYNAYGCLGIFAQ